MRKLIVILLFGIPSLASAGGTGNFQYLYTAFLDVQGLFPKTLAACTRVAPETTEPLQKLFEQWKAEHGVFQPELQSLIRQYYVNEVGEEKAAELIEQIRANVAAEIAPLHFPQNHEFKDAYFCTRMLPADFKGEDLALKFGDYVRANKAK